MVSILIQGSAHTAHQMNHVTVKLHILIEIPLHIVAVTAQIISCQIHKHDMLSILLRVITEELCSLSILFHITRSAGSSCNRINESLLSNNTIVSLR